MGAHFNSASHVHLTVLKDSAEVSGEKKEQFVKPCLLGIKLS